MSEQPDRFTTEGALDEVLDAIEARLRASWESEHPDGFEGNGWDEWQQEYERRDAAAGSEARR